jgi:trehalose/maltose transport system substrate-binding protein
MARRGIVVAAVATLLTGLTVAGCGGGGGNGAAQLNFYIFPEPSGSFDKAAKTCSQQSHGAYTISVNTLPSDADGQRQQLVRRLSAQDSSIDIIGMDVTWTAEFATAGWIKPWTGAAALQVTRGTLPVPLKTASYKGKLWGAPANSNTQLLWYRKDLVKTPPKTWAQMIAMSAALAKQGKPHYIEVQGRQYEGLTVWFNSLNASAGGTILSPTGKVALGPPAVKAATIIKQVASGPGADPGLSQAQEDQGRLAFEKGGAAFELNYPFVWPSAQANAPKIFKNMGYAPWPGVNPGQPARVTIGGINFGVGGYTKHPKEAFAAAACLRNMANQKLYALKGGLPPTLNALYNDPSLAKPYPFKNLIRQQLNTASVRPQSAAYADISLAISKGLSPPDAINPPSILTSLKGQLKKAQSSGALL